MPLQGLVLLFIHRRWWARGLPWARSYSFRFATPYPNLTRCFTDRLLARARVSPEVWTMDAEARGPERAAQLAELIDRVQHDRTFRT